MFTKIPLFTVKKLNSYKLIESGSHKCASLQDLSNIAKSRLSIFAMFSRGLQPIKKVRNYVGKFVTDFFDR